MTSPHPVLLDTDIGSDVDDAMALALVLGTGDRYLVGITTVYGDTLLRARIARRYASLAGHRVRVHPGIAEPLSGREVWWAGHEGSLHPDLGTEQVDPVPAVDALLAAASARPGALDVVAIGPLTNIAAAIDRDPAFVGRVRCLYVMGGDFSGAEDEHNFRSDSVAAGAVFDSGIPAVVCGLEITRQIRIQADQLTRLRATGALGTALGADIDQWWQYWDEQWNVPHDPVTVLTLTRPDLFRLSGPGLVSVAAGSSPSEGRSTFVPSAGGNVRIVRELDADAVVDEMVTGIVRAGEAGPRRPA